MVAVDRDFGLSNEQHEIVATVRAFVNERVAPAAGEFEEKGEFPRELFRGLGDMGLAGVPYEEGYGGGGQSYLTYLVEIGRAHV